MFDVFRKKKQSASFSPRQEIERLTELSPPSTLIALVKKGVEEPEDMGKAFFLRKDKKLYTEGSHLYLTTPDGVKISKDQNVNAKNVLLQGDFVSSRRWWRPSIFRPKRRISSFPRAA